MVTDEQSACVGRRHERAYSWKQGALPSETKTPRAWRTRPDPFAAVWVTDVVPLLEADEHGVLEAKPVVAELRRRHGDKYNDGHLRTMQRRLQDAFDSPKCGGARHHDRRQAFVHLLFHFVLSFSKWRWPCVFGMRSVLHFHEPTDPGTNFRPAVLTN